MGKWLMIVALLASPLAAAERIDGTIRVKDGDTLEVAGRSVRLHGIDAPESDQMCGAGGNGPLWACGAWVTSEVRARFQGARADCAVVDTDRYGRAVARCMVDGQDMGRVLVREGLAFAYRRYSMDYDLDEKSAVVEGRGLHGADVTLPADFRAFRRDLPAVSAGVAPDGCTIKGNISSDGKRIYHVPGQDWYSRTRIDTAKGERWFCSETEARDAGWRRARR
ncbi:thermonuclease family protein [Thetidibacter halocola]|uniref:Thermonuclease family protein n=1 Tax=Thetidibacter halocola TaxID=2827239 RepID=A0A8J8B9J9_9RHOB|nr:thermonuclease family protein [Thetidibacter halocola]MBS0126587.1 thermonuclease family protein [Thetidibacter halocola]